MKKAFGGIAGWVCLWGALAYGQGAVLQGRVTDEAQRPVTDALVTLTFENGPHVLETTTDASGGYRLLAVPAGNHELTVDAEGFALWLRRDVTVRLGQALVLDAALTRARTEADETELEGPGPSVDQGSMQLGLHVTEEETRRLPLVAPGTRNAASRSFEALAELAPGVLPERYGLSVHGASSVENGYFIDGLNVGDPAVSLLATPLSLELLEEVHVVTAGFLPEHGRASGGVLRAVTRTGGSRWRGGVFGAWVPGALEGKRGAVGLGGTSVQTEQRLWNLGDFGGEVSGPIVKDRLFLSAGFVSAFTRYRLARSVRRVAVDDNGAPLVDLYGRAQTEEVPGSAQGFFADQRRFHYLGKLTYAPSGRHRIHLSVFGTPTQSATRGAFDLDPYTGLPPGDLSGSAGTLAHVRTANATGVALQTSSSYLRQRLVLETALGWHHQDQSSLPVDGSALASNSGLAGVAQTRWRRRPAHSLKDFEAVPGGACGPSGALCPVDAYRTGGPGELSTALLDRYQARGSVAYRLQLLGTHWLKAGVDLEHARYRHHKAFSGGALYEEWEDGSAFWKTEYGEAHDGNTATRFSSVRSRVMSTTLGSYLQDSWSVLDVFRVNAGVRYDTQTLYGANGQPALSLPHQLSPRVGVLYDFTRAGRSRLFAHYARYYQSVPLALVDRLTASPTVRSAVSAAACNPQDPGQQELSCEDPANAVDVGTDPAAPRRYVASTPVTVDANVLAPAVDEVVVGGEYEAFPGGVIGLTFTKRYLQSALETLSVDGQSVLLANPGRGAAASSAPAVRDYDAVTLSFSKVFARQWLGQASYTFATLRGNMAGPTGDFGELVPHGTTLFDSGVGATGPLPLDVRHQLKLFAAKEVPLGAIHSLTVGGAHRSFSGTPVSYLVVDDEGRRAYLLPRGAAGRLPWVHTLDARLAYQLRLTPANTLTASLDVFNLLGLQSALRVDERYTFSDVTPLEEGSAADLPDLRDTRGRRVRANPNYKETLEFQPPREVRLGLRVTF